MLAADTFDRSLPPTVFLTTDPVTGGALVLNSALVLAMRLSSETVQALLATHRALALLRAEMERAGSPDALLALARVHDGIEADQQRLWGFGVDASFRHWSRVPRCACCKRTNAFFHGKPIRAVNEACPVHGQLLGPVEEGSRPSPGYPGLAPEGHRVLRIDTDPEGARVAAFRLP